jgi:dephospho-CoA kinase
MSRFYKIGITGGIASGKSRCLKHIAETYPRIYTLNLDLVAFRMYSLNPKVMDNLQVIFGKKVV